MTGGCVSPGWYAASPGWPQEPRIEVKLWDKDSPVDQYKLALWIKKVMNKTTTPEALEIAKRINAGEVWEPMECWFSWNYYTTLVSIQYFDEEGSCPKYNRRE